MTPPATVSPAKPKTRRFVMSIMPEDEENLTSIVDHHRKEAGYPVKIAEIQRRLWREEVARIKRKA